MQPPRALHTSDTQTVFSGSGFHNTDGPFPDDGNPPHTHAISGLEKLHVVNYH